MQIILFEDSSYSNFYPLTCLRPVYMLRAGIQSLFKRIETHFEGCRVTLTCRQEIAGSLAEAYPDYPVNIIKKNDSDILLLNGRVRSFSDLKETLNNLSSSSIIINADNLIAVYIKVEDLKKIPDVATIEQYASFIDNSENFTTISTTANLFNYCWEIMADIEKEIISDFTILESTFPESTNVKVHDGASFVEKDHIYLGSNVEILPAAVLDASNGPIYIGENCRIESHAAIYGPVYIGPNSTVLAGKVSTSSIGHTCKVGGEVEWTIFHSYVNKYHDGFVGHSYVGQWVNFGAMTTNSDLKNNYSEIRTKLNGKAVDTNSNKVGSFIGDHTKFGIGTLLNTGINIGVCCNLFGGTLITDKEVKSFSWGNSGNYKKYDIEKVIETARIVTSRRGIELSAREEELLRNIANEQTTSDGIFEIKI